MVYDHVPCVILDENVSLDALKRFTFVLLPNVGIVRDAEVELLRRHVEGGGKVILTDLRGCHDRMGRVGTSSSLEALPGARFVLTFACSPDHATASEHHIVEACRLLAGAVRFLHPEPRARILAPAKVEAVVTDEPRSRTLRIQLLGYCSPPQTASARNRPYVLPALIEDSPIYRVTIDLDRDIAGARAFSKETELSARGRRVEAAVHDVHEVNIIAY